MANPGTASVPSSLTTGSVRKQSMLFNGYQPGIHKLRTWA